MAAAVFRSVMAQRERILSAVQTCVPLCGCVVEGPPVLWTQQYPQGRLGPLRHDPGARALSGPKPVVSDANPNDVPYLFLNDASPVVHPFPPDGIGSG